MPSCAPCRSRCRTFPSFADVIERVKPAVVAVKVKVQNVADRDDDGDGQQFSMPDLPPGHPMERFFRQFRDQMPGRGDRGPRQERPRQFGQSLGSGFFISADGYVVTNNHVVDNGSEVQITMDDGKTLDAKVIGTDPKTDLALLKVEGKRLPLRPPRRPEGPDRRLGGGHRQPVRPRRHGDGRHRLGPAPRHRRRSL